MAGETRPCVRCGEELPVGATICPACFTPAPSASGVVEDGPADPVAETPSARKISASPAVSTDLGRRVQRLQQWADAGQALGLSLPVLPAWADEFARGAADPEPWVEVVAGVERISQKKVVRALEDWERLTKNRLQRLEAYSVDGRLEREQMEDILHGARAGEIAQALSAYQQVDRVVALKERHLDQAREELERLVSMLRDMQALSLATPQDPSELSEDLERELRSGRLAPLKQQLRALRSQAVARLKVGLPQYVSRYGEFLVRERQNGVSIDLEAAELARGSREFVRGHPEEALRRLRVLAQVHGSGAGHPSRSRSRSTEASPTESSRTT
ncbi:MAG: hypothetical protein L3K17_10660 [Thermoplasmata archaeon]|nr:hypothetical protein [Thermoplasmata archaeon]